MPEVRGHSFSFDRGIESITRATKAQASALGGLPERADAPPADLNNRPQLDQLLHQPSLNDQLEEQLRPRLEHRDLLTPTRFREELGHAQSHLRDSADALLQKGPDHADAARGLNRAARLLQDESQLRELLQTYRSALFQG